MKQADKSSDSPPGHGHRDPEDGMSDEEAINAVFAGDTEAFAVIVRRYQSTLLGYLVRMLGDVEEAEDAAQEAFVKAYTSLGRYDPRRPFQPWLFRIATNTAISHQRSRSRRPATRLTEEHRDISPTPQQVAESSEAEAHLERAVADLPSEARDLYDLRYRQELSVEDIGRIVGRRPNAIAVALHRLRARLRGILSAEGNSTTPRENQP
jgi:RNA polymerase sigma-70 factor (ECF subfamily)